MDIGGSVREVFASDSCDGDTGASGKTGRGGSGRCGGEDGDEGNRCSRGMALPDCTSRTGACVCCTAREVVPSAL